MSPQLKDPRRQEDVVHDLASLIRTSVLLAARGWRDHDDADALRDDPAFRLAASSASGRTPLDRPHGLASQPTLSRFAAIMAEPSNRSVLRNAALELGARAARAERGGKRPRRLTLDVDSLPIEVHGHQPKAEWNGHYRGRIYHPLITSVAETGDMLDARLRPGNVGTAEGALDVDRLRRGTPAILGARICSRCIFEAIAGSLSAPIGTPRTECFALHFHTPAPGMAGVPLRSRSTSHASRLAVSPRVASRVCA